MPDDPARMIDARSLMRELSVEELCATAEEYFRRLTNLDYHLAKPFASVDEAPELVISFMHVLLGLKLAPEMVVLDFGAGSCWSSRYLTQLGMEVIAMDASSSALEIGRQLYARNPVFGEKPPPRFLPFDGRRFDLPDRSVDRVLCYDAFHHVPNPEEVLREMGRVLKPAGIAGFSEPGPDHSRSPQSQYEMRTFGVLENDVSMGEIQDWSRRAGFERLHVSVFSSLPFHLPLDEFDAFLERSRGGQRYLDATREYLRNRRLFFLTKAGTEIADSRQRAGLKAELQVDVSQTRVRPGKPFSVSAWVTNIGSAAWRPSTARIGAVNLGVHLCDPSGRVLNLDYFRQPLSPERVVRPGETLELKFQVPSPPTGRYVLEFDLVSEAVCWFATNGSRTVRIAVEVE